MRNRQLSRSVATSSMDITGLGWSGTRTERSEEAANFYESVLVLRPVHTDRLLGL
jgi:hypothetical protein